MLYSKKTEYLMESIRSGRTMARSEKLNLIVGLSIPSMLAQISTVLMFFIYASPPLECLPSGVVSPSFPFTLSTPSAS